MSANQAVWEQAGFEEALLGSASARSVIRSGKVACALVVFLMPAGIIVRSLLSIRTAGFISSNLRLLCSALASRLVGFVHTRPLSQPLLPVSGNSYSDPTSFFHLHG